MTNEYRIKHAIRKSLTDPRGAGADLNCVPSGDGQLAVRGYIDLSHLARDIAEALTEGDQS